MDAAFDIDAKNKRILNASVVLGTSSNESASVLKKTSGIQMYGQLNELDCKAWWHWMQKQKLLLSQFSSKQNVVDIFINKIEIAHLSYGAHAIENVSVRGDITSKMWQFIIKSTQFSGTIGGKKNEPFFVNASVLRLPSLKELKALYKKRKDQKNTQTSFSMLSMFFKKMSQLNLNIEHIYAGDFLLGYAHTNIVHVPHGMELRNIDVLLNQIHVKGTLTWNETAVASTQFSGVVKTNDLVSALKAFNYENDRFEAKKIRVVTHCSWPGDPLNFDIKKIKGNAEVKIQHGHIHASGADSLQLLGLLNIDAIFNVYD